jgi:hypothetical protein
LDLRKGDRAMMILGEHYDEYFGLDEYDAYDPFEGEENEEDS